MLRQDVIQAVEEGQFSVYAVEHAEQAMELLSDMPPGAPDDRGHFPEQSLNGRIQQRLAEWITIHQQLTGQVPGGGND
jgi:predicted ATP-dependent protease